MTYISSQSMLSPMRLSVLQAQSSLAQAQTEVATGTKSDLGVALGARTSTSLSMKIEIDSLGAFSDSNAIATTRLGATADTLTSFLSTAQAMSSSLITASTAGATAGGLQASAKAALQALIAGLNTSAGGRYVFAGIDSDEQPLASYSTSPPSASKASIDAAYASAFGAGADPSTLSGSAMTSFLDAQFADQFDDANWSSNWSKASDTTITTNLSPTRKAGTSISANAAAFRNLAQAYTMLSEYAGDGTSADAKAAVVAKATSLVQSGISALTEVQSQVGTAQTAIETANTRSSAQIAILKSNVGDLESVDTYALSSRITALQTQLEASYQLTSRLQQLSLVNYLNG